MTDIEIINEAYGCIAEKANCENCSRDSACTADECMGWLIGDLLDIIERLQERVAIQQEPCKYCDATEKYQCKICTDKINGGDVAIEAFKNEWTIRIEHEGIEEYYVLEVPINYCPICGRNLKEGEQK
jgi:hypothetical protein